MIEREYIRRHYTRQTAQLHERNVVLENSLRDGGQEKDWKTSQSFLTAKRASRVALRLPSG